MASLKHSAEDGPVVDGYTPSASAGPSRNLSTEATSIKRSADNASDATGEDVVAPAKKRGRPKGSKNKAKSARD